MAKYKVGDRVRIVEKWNDGCCQNTDGLMDEWLGQTMTIKCIYYGDYFMAEDNGSWVWNDSCIAGLVDDEKIVVTHDGKTVTAKKYLGKKLVGTGIARCAPVDAFDFDTGARIALGRLLRDARAWGGEITPEKIEALREASRLLRNVAANFESIADDMQEG